MLSRLRELGDEELTGVARMRAVAALRPAHPIALADCFAIATAAAQNATAGGELCDDGGGEGGEGGQAGQRVGV